MEGGLAGHALAAEDLDHAVVFGLDDADLEVEEGAHIRLHLAAAVQAGDRYRLRWPVIFSNGPRLCVQ